MDLLVKVVVVGLLLAGFWVLLQPRYAFVVSVEGGVPRVSRGKVMPAFLEEVGHACAELGVSHGWVAGVQRGRRVALTFSRHFAPAARQRLRNLWTLHG